MKEIPTNKIKKLLNLDLNLNGLSPMEAATLLQANLKNINFSIFSYEQKMLSRNLGIIELHSQLVKIILVYAYINKEFVYEKIEVVPMVFNHVDNPINFIFKFKIINNVLVGVNSIQKACHAIISKTTPADIKSWPNLIY